MRARRSVLLVLALILFQASIAQAQQAPWTGIAADEARPATTGGGIGGIEATGRAMSADGRFVVLYSGLAHLVAGDTNNTHDVFLRDRLTGELRRISVASDGTEGNNYSVWANISANGRHIAFNSCATNLVPGDTNNSCDLFIHDRELGTTVLGNLGTNGEQSTISTQHHFNLSGDGRYFVFNAGFGGYERRVYLRDRDTDGNGVFDEPGTAVTTLISLPEVGSNGYDDEEVAISNDAHWIAYSALTLDEYGSPVGARLYLYDRITTTTVRVDRAIGGGADVPGYASLADFSESGHILYSSNVDNLAEGDTNGDDDMYVYDIAAGVNTRIEFPQPEPQTTYVWAGAISADGRFVAFTVADYGYSYYYVRYNVYAVDRQSGVVTPISVWPNGTLDDGAGPPSMSADGLSIAFSAGPEMLWLCCNDGVFVATGVALSPEEIEVAPEGGTVSIEVTMPAGIAWTLNTAGAPGAEFSQTSGVGPATIEVTIGPNPGFDGDLDYWVALGSESVHLLQGTAPHPYFVWPQSGSLAGGTDIEIYGWGFAEGATVTIGGVPATNVVVISDERINATTPANPAGMKWLTVTNPNGASGDTPFYYMDDTPPVITHEISGTLGQNGWYTSDVQVSWNYEDPESQVFLNGCQNPVTVTEDAVSQLVWCSVQSDGGTTFEEIAIKRDTTPPVIAIAPFEPQTYFQGQLVDIAHHCSDLTSGIATCTANQTGTHLDTSTVGSFEFSVTAVDNAGHSTTTATAYTVKVKPVINVALVSATYGETALLQATMTAFNTGAPLAGRVVTFFVDYINIGTAITSATGEALLPSPTVNYGAGSHVLHVEFAGDDAALPAIGYGDLTIAKANPVLTWATPAPIAHGTPLGSAQLNATSSVAGAFGYDPSEGTVLPAGLHSLTAMFAPIDSANYNIVSKTVTLKVKAVPLITWATPAAITYPEIITARELNAVANVAGSFVYSPAWGVRPPAGLQTLSVTFTPSNTADYVPTTATVTLEVLKGTVTFTWPHFDPIIYGTPLSATQLNASASALNGTVTYDPPAGTVLNAGTHTLTAIYTPGDPANYYPATTTKSILVGKRYPPIWWQGDLAPIVYGTPLGAAQLYATSTVPGTITYDPPAGTVLNAGARVISMTFTPDDTVNYHTVTAQKDLVVQQVQTSVTWATPANIVYGTMLGAAQLNATASVPGTFSYSPAAGTILPAGLHSLYVNFTPTDSVNYATSNKYVGLVVEKKTPVITWNNPAPITYGTALGWTQYNSTVNVGGGYFQFDPPHGTVLNAGAGQTLTATYYPDSNNYNYVSKSVTIDVLQATPVITWGTIGGMNYGTPLGATHLDATANVPGTFMYTPGAGTVLSGGSHTLSARFTPDSGNYATVEQTQTVTVIKVMPAVTWQWPAAITYGTPLTSAQLNAAANVAGTFTYTPAPGTILDAGSRTLSATFTPDEPSNYHSVNMSVPIEVAKATPILTWPTPAPIVYPTPLSATQLNATANTAGTFEYAPVAGSVYVGGTHPIGVTFTPLDTNNYTTAYKFVTIEVIKATPVLSWPSPPSITYGTGLAAQLNPTADVAGTFAFSPGFGTVLDAGSHILTATFTPHNAAAYTSATASVTLVVTKAAPVVSWANPAAILYGTALSGTQLNATANVAGSFAYSPAAGTVLGAGTQNLSVTFTPDSANYDAAAGSVSLVVAKAGTVVTWANPAGITYGTALSATQLNATANLPGSFAYSPAEGTVLSAGTHNLSATFTPDDSANYDGATAVASIVVAKAGAVVAWANPAEITYGTALSAAQLNASANVAGSFAYTPGAGAVLGAGTHNLSATFTPDDSANYDGASAGASLVVAKAAAVVTWANPAGITYGTALSAAQLNASANVAGSFAYSPAAGTVLGAGTHNLSVTFTPDDSANYVGETANASIAVAKAAPVVTWSNPAGITYGTALSATQLNASANVAGSFAYSPSAGTVLGAGTHNLSVTFTPADAANYTSAEASASVVIAPRALTVQANDASKVYGQALPAFTATGSGFVNGDSTASLGGALAFATSATATSAPGTYAVTPSGVSSANYSITFAAGSLTVAKAATSVTLTTTPNPSNNNQVVQMRAVVSAVAPGAGTATGTVEFRENGTLLGTATLVNGVATLNKSFKRGSHPLTATYAGNANFNGSSGGVTHSVP